VTCRVKKLTTHLYHCFPSSYLWQSNQPLRISCALKAIATLEPRALLAQKEKGSEAAAEGRPQGRKGSWVFDSSSAFAPTLVAQPSQQLTAALPNTEI